MYDHDEGHAITGGFAYHGRIAALRGKFVFGDINNGRVFAADLAEMKKADDGDTADRGADRGSPALRARRQRQSDRCIDARARRSDDGREHPARRSPHQPDRRRRTAAHVQTGRHDPDAGSGLRSAGDRSAVSTVFGRTHIAHANCETARKISSSAACRRIFAGPQLRDAIAPLRHPACPSEPLSPGVARIASMNAGWEGPKTCSRFPALACY